MARSYDYDGEAFYADPEKYKFTREEIQALNESDLREFEQRTPMTGPEKRALRKESSFDSHIDRNAFAFHQFIELFTGEAEDESRGTAACGGDCSCCSGCK